MVKIKIVGLLLSCILLSCTDKSPQKKHHSKPTQNKIDTRHPSTKVMADELLNLYKKGKPTQYYHWNSQLSHFIKQRMDQAKEPEKTQLWFKYCTEMLFGGDSKMAIYEIEQYLNQYNRPYTQVLDQSNKALFELLALAYLRLGEQENCQNNHTPYSCILPLAPPAIHQLTEGSQKAIETYELLYSKFPNEKYKWLINLAYMTLGEYPEKVPSHLLITYPNWKLEQENFPRFSEISMSIGVAQNGLSGGTSIEDFNNDGFLDIFATSYGMLDQVKLFINDQKGGFTDQTIASGLEGIVSGLNCLHADYNNDGHKDILILRGAWLGEFGTHPNSLLKNNGDGTFEDVTIAAGLSSRYPTQTAKWADFNKDGYLDLFIGNESTETVKNPCELYQNNGDGTFKNVADQFGLDKIFGLIKGVDWGDIDNDGWPELLISINGAPNVLFKNEKGQLSKAKQSVTIEDPLYSFPCWFWDVNNDGYLDIYIASYDTRNHKHLADDFAKELQGIPVTTDKPRLYINQKGKGFKDQTKAFHLDKTVYAMGANFGDLDNDGFLDCYIGTGAPDFSTVVPNRMFKNQGGKTFEEVTSAGGFGHIQKGHAIAFGDIDRDGDQDIYAVMGGAYEGDNFTNVLFENPIDTNRWIVIELVGVTTNRDAIGTRIELVLSNGQHLYRTVGTGGSFGASSLQQEIGIGQANLIQTMIIYWQNGEAERFQNIQPNQKIKVTEGNDTIETLDNYKIQPFVQSNASSHQHH